jgi:prepilin-type N-terminal cleavage/methylation domain-containing protein
MMTLEGIQLLSPVYSRNREPMRFSARLESRPKGKNRIAQGFSPGCGFRRSIALEGRPSRASRCSAFSLVEVLVSLFVLSIAAIAITSAWRLADYQELLVRIDRRAERILREYYELQTFAPASYKPFVVTGDSNQQSSRNSITGYLYHPRLIGSQSGQSQFGNLIPFTISLTNGNGTVKSQLVLTYTVPSYGTQQSQQLTKTVKLNP